MVRQYRRYKNIDNQIRYLKPDGLQLSSPPDPLAVAVGAIPPVSAMISDPYDGHHCWKCGTDVIEDGDGYVCPKCKRDNAGDKQ